MGSVLSILATLKRVFDVFAWAIAKYEAWQLRRQIKADVVKEQNDVVKEKQNAYAKQSPAGISDKQLFDWLRAQPAVDISEASLPGAKSASEIDLARDSAKEQ